jgi:Yip1 domain
MRRDMAKSQSFSVRFYLYALSKLIGQPRQFFSEMQNENGWQRSLGFLLVSSTIFTGAFLLNTRPIHPGVTGSILLANALGMTVIAAGLGYMIMVMVRGRQTPFVRMFNIYAYCSGITLLASWLPYFIFLTEPWKWWLIGTGLRRSAGFKPLHVVVVVSLSIITMIAFFGSLLHLIVSNNG